MLRLSALLFAWQYVGAVVIRSGAGAGGVEFDGIGGLSGGGGCSRLLPNYPPQQQAEVLDLLFAPQRAASLQILKVEIGGDAQSTVGTEASHAHTAAEMASGPNFQRGYEAWLMVEAKKRNPHIVLYGLPWAWPGWLRDGPNGTSSSNPLADNTAAAASYVASWVAGMRDSHGLTIDYVSIWNEMDANLRAGAPRYIPALRAALDARGCRSTRIVADDGHSFSDITDYLGKGDAALDAAVEVLGAHYPGTRGPGLAASGGRKAWSSEDFSQDNDKSGSACWARVINRNFVAGNLTASIAWNLVDAYYDGLPYVTRALLAMYKCFLVILLLAHHSSSSTCFPLASLLLSSCRYGRNGLMTAHWPWSGNYEVDNPIWASAHTTQFTQVGWRYAPVGGGSGGLQGGGSFVTLTPPNAAAAAARSPPPPPPLATLAGQPALTIVVEKMDPTTSVCRWEGAGNHTVPRNESGARFVIDDVALCPAVHTLAVWRSQMGPVSGAGAVAPSGDAVFQSLPPLAVRDEGGGTCSFALDLAVNHLYTLTTVSGGAKGIVDPASVPSRRGFWDSEPALYTDDFESYALASEAKYFSDMSGSFEIVDSATTQGKAANAHGNNKVMRQMVPEPPIFGIRSEVRPITLIGEASFESVSFEVDVLLEEQGGSAFVGLGFLGLTDGPGFFLRVATNSSTFDTASTVKKIGTETDAGFPRGALPGGGGGGGGGTAALEPGAWHRLGLSAKGGLITGTFDGAVLFESFEAPRRAGFCVLGTGSYDLAQFDNVAMNLTEPPPPPTPPTPPTPAPPTPSPVPPPPAPPASCKTPAAGDKVVLWTCDPSRSGAQSWNVTAASAKGGPGAPVALLRHPALCLSGGKLVACSDGAPRYVLDGAVAGGTPTRLVEASSGKCLDVAPHRQPDTSYPTDAWACNDQFDGGANERFVLQGDQTSFAVHAIVSELWDKNLCVSVCEVA